MTDNIDYKEIEILLDRDQNAIKDYKAGKINLDDIRNMNSENLNTLKNYVKRYGFPFKNVTSEKAYSAAFLIIQHSGDAELIEETIKNWSNCSEDQIEKKDLAYLIDRALILKNLPQRFGTQYKLINNEVIFFDIENVSMVDELRKEYELGTLEEYKDRILN